MGKRKKRHRRRKNDQPPRNHAPEIPPEILAAYYEDPIALTRDRDY